MSANLKHQLAFHSKFGGLWIDRTDFPQESIRRFGCGEVSAELEGQIRQFEHDGYIVLEKAASEDELTRFESAISDAFLHGHEQLISQVPGIAEHRRVTAGLDRKGTRIVDSFAVLREALDLLSSPRLVQFLAALFQEKPKLFQSLSFDMGSEQGLHQDTAYVVVNRPMELLACWIALEDVRPGSGELQYMVGSHRLPDFDFGGNKKHWNSDTDEPESHNRWARWIRDEGACRNYLVQSFMAKRGDILVWHADLAHGGAPIKDPTLTRKSLVGHFCPDSALPNFVQSMPQRARSYGHRGISYCSGHYDLSTMKSWDQGGS
jgi:phytanoyl-CoA hydroxylase